jgi:hypothetical protein
MEEMCSMRSAELTRRHATPKMAPNRTTNIITNKIA